MERIYMDYAATSFIRNEVFCCMEPYLKQKFGNPSGIYESGRQARDAIENARQVIAKLLGAQGAKEIYFTSGGTESDNWAIRGAAGAPATRGKHIVTTNVEHHAVLETCGHLEKQGVEVTYLPVDAYGVVSAKQVKEAIRRDTVVVSVIYANNEVGAVNPVADIAAAAREAGVLLHTDAVAAAGHLPVDAGLFDMVSISAHKFYGPKGVGVLYIRDGAAVGPLMFGGKQERGRRAGTENVAGIVGCAEALRLACEEMDKENERLAALRDHMERTLAARIPDIRINSNCPARLSNYVNICLPGVGAQAALVALDMAGVECSSGSACTTGGVQKSHVLQAMGRSGEEAGRALRFTLGAATTKEQVEYVVDRLARLCQQRVNNKQE